MSEHPAAPSDPAVGTPTPGPAADVLQICRELIRIDTTNRGGNVSVGEPEAAEYCAAWMRRAGMAPRLFESAPGRVSVVGHLPGWDPDAPGLVVHGHTDVVPAEAEEWSVDPFGAELKDGMVWGRGAVDMKGMDAMVLSTLVHLARTGRRPRRPLTVALFADEEAGGVYGAHWIVDHHPEVFAGCTEAVSEVGGFSTEVGGTRAYLVQTAEKGLAWLNLATSGTPGHGSAPHEDNAVTRLAGAVDRIGRHTWPLTYTATTRHLLEQVAEITGTEFDEADPTPQLTALGHAGTWVAGTLHTTANPTGLRAGYKHNVIPSGATATVDARLVPGHEEEALSVLGELAGPGVRISPEHRDVGLEVPFSGDLVELMVDALGAEDPGAHVLPFMLGGGTDNKALSRLGITGYGFSPLQLPPDLPFTALFHGIDERVPVEALRFGCRVLERMLEPR
ncbi:M20/M25/M40 family metallo-hydrolase [Micrococcus sp.]|uniref:M20/M25/M40 family metallo-hydrolase n=1 Tax=Micrococcus sp. TaxID=1271 RepID=UPI002A90EE03|nr:M20/M25/M40 family metallo-hydrolase [Micrococcus sp.]MDY6055390.1 M20/M25/M40 family metallo-hydrolase [Micrococcus sp.]